MSVFNQRTFNRLLDQYMTAVSEESRNGAAQGLRSEYGWCLRSQRSGFLMHDQHDDAKALTEIIDGSPDKPKHKIIECGHDFSLIGEYFKNV